MTAASPAGARYAEVAVDVAVPGTDRLFHYEIPPDLQGVIRPGHRVRVPFGRRVAEGIVLGLRDAAPEGVPALKEIAALLDAEPLLAPGLLGLAAWLAEHTLSLRAQALRCLLPPGARGGRVRPRTLRVVRLADAEAAAARVGDLAPRQGQAVRYLLEAGAGVRLTRGELARRSGAGGAAVRALLQKGLLVEEAAPARRDPFAGTAGDLLPPLPAPALPLSAAQAEALVAVTSALARAEPAGPGRPAGPDVFLLFGVTGSGKTEVYLRAIEAARGMGRQALLLVPEIALTPQLVGLLRGRFGERVALLHSALSPGERFDEWQRVRTGQVDVAVGARSAVFAPFERLGLVILDEEHETTYKQEEAPRYHARAVALERARREGAVVLLGSATPSLESYRAAAQGEYRLLRLAARVDGRPLPRYAVVDMREELERGNRSIFSARLTEAVRERLARREQVILFLNRRGYHTFVLCRDCGYGARCPHCDVSLTVHRGAAPSLRCHYCGHGQALPAGCPACGSRRFRYFGAGTEQVEALARERFPGARILRMDQDTTGRRGAHAAIYRQFLSGEADILVGTQMIAKGWDVAGVTLVGVVSADTALHLPDFRAAERTYQLLTQVGGRAGRGDVPGEVIVQTYAPEHHAVRAAAGHDADAFYRRELLERRRLGFPPFSHLLRLVVAHRDEGQAEAAARRLAEAALALGARPWDDGGTAAGGATRPVEVLGPAPAPLARLHGCFRWHLLLRAGDREDLLRMARALPLARAPRRGEAQIAVDPDPVSLL